MTVQLQQKHLIAAAEEIMLPYCPMLVDLYRFSDTFGKQHPAAYDTFNVIIDSNTQ